MSADQEPLEESRARALSLMEADAFDIRSCHECNPAHEHFTKDESCVILCFACGRYWLGGIDLSTEPSQPEPAP